MARDASQDPRVAAKERMERGGTGLHRGLDLQAWPGQGGEDEALARRRRGMQAGARNAVATTTSTGQGQCPPMRRTRTTSMVSKIG